MSHLQEFSGQTALVTGAARGIGLAIARALAAAGARVVIADVNAAAGDPAAASLRADGHAADFLPLDLAAAGAGSALIAATARLTGSVDVLINNARAGRRLGLLDETEANWDLAQDVGLKSAFFASQAAIKLMADRGGCRIVNIASVAAVLATNEAPSYHATKAALVQLTKYLAVAGGPHRARVNAVLPGMIVQDEHRPRFEATGNEAFRATTRRYQPLGEVGSEQDVADAVLYLCSTRSRYVSGTCLVIDGGATAQEPLGLLLRPPASPPPA
jgi:NAD(P)-dependent dehydrogenase (short-subunit alcohol dehydrogenase family)